MNIEQGPKAGCSFECKAATIATVGRARASTFQISRDPGISQKHLCFQWRDDDDDAHAGWTAMDVGSSNGTIINGILVEPLKGVYLHTGDLIKIGSETTIRVEVLGVTNEVVAVPKAAKKKGTCNVSESHGKVTTVVVRPARKAGRAAGKALAAHECQGKQLDVMEGEVHHGKHNMVEVHGKQKDGMSDESNHGKQHGNMSEEEGHCKHQDATANTVFSENNQTNHTVEEGHGGNMTAYRHCQGRHDINNEAEDGHGKQGCSARAYKHHEDKHDINNVNNDKGNTVKMESTSRYLEYEAENATAASADINLSMTVEQWFQHLMEEGPKYLHQVSESIIQDITLESKQFDEYMLSLI